MSTLTVPESMKSLVGNFEQVYREFAPLVYRTAWGVMGSKGDAEDILQSVFLKLLRRDFPPDLQKNPKAYLYRAAVTVSLDTLKARRRRPALVVDDVARLEVRAEASNAAFDENLHERLYAAIAQLNPEAAEVLILHYMNNKSTAEIARMLGVSRTAVAVRLFRSRARLRKILRSRMEES